MNDKPFDVERFAQRAGGGEMFAKTLNKSPMVKPTLSPIFEFQGEYRFLSNFWISPLWYDGVLFPTVEHAFQAAKSLDFEVRWNIGRLDRPDAAKRAGRGQEIMPGWKPVELRPDWEAVKVNIMRELLILKFAAHPELRNKLVATGEAELIEGNSWNDRFWGKVSGVGENHLGILLMEVRKLFS